MRLRGERGQMLVQVLVTLATVAVIATVLMQLILMRMTVANRLVSGGQGKMGAQAGYQLLLDDWASNGTCHNPAQTGGNPFCATYTGGGANTCGCTCTGTVAGNLVSVTTQGTPGNCSITSTFVSP